MSKASVIKPRGIVDRSLVARARDILFEESPAAVRFLAEVRDGKHDDKPPAVVRNRLRAAVALIERTVPSIHRVEYRARVAELAPAPDEKRVEAEATVVTPPHIERAAIEEAVRRITSNGSTGELPH